MLFINKTIDQMDANTLYQLLKLRADVFVVEQACIYSDLDDKDVLASTWHIFQEQGGRVVSCARCLAPGVGFEHAAAIGRVAVASAHRGGGVARKLVREAVDLCQQEWPQSPVMVAAQAYLVDFYGSFGFQPVGEAYDEDGIPHQNMTLDVRSKVL